MARDIEEFLRKAAERRNKKAEQSAPQPVAHTTPSISNPPPRPQPQPPRPQRSQMVVAPEEVEIIRSESVAKHVERHLNTSEIARHVEQLGDVIEQADERMEAHIHKAFDPNGTPGAEEAARQSPAKLAGAELLHILRSPKTIRHAIIIAEIMKRPEF
jgi:hypothetical protein